jgi:hypothetical protein
MSALLAPTFLFRFSAPCRYAKDISAANPGPLAEQYRLPCFAELDERKPFADLRLAWNETGLAVYLKVEGKQQLPWCRDNKIEDSDGLQIWIDTRDTKTVHRAGRFCHRFAILPLGSGRNLDQPTIGMLAINRARESPREIHERQLVARSKRLASGYELEAFLPAEALTGYDPAEHPKLGFSYAVFDRELGKQNFTIGPEFATAAEDPSLWATLELVRD